MINVGFSVTATKIIFFIAAALVAIGLISIITVAIQSYTVGVEEKGKIEKDRFSTAIKIESQERNIPLDPLTFYVRNTGKTILDPEKVIVIVDWQISTRNTKTNLNGNELWKPTDVLKIEVYDITLTPGDHIVKITTENEVSDEMMFYISSEDLIEIDGTFYDWAFVPPYADSVSEPSTNPSGDPDNNILEFAYAENDTHYLFYIKVEGTVLGGSGIGNPDEVGVLIDKDRNESSGYRDDNISIGADYAIIITGNNGVISDASMKEFTGSDQTDWSWSSIAVTVNAINNASRPDQIEFAVSKSELRSAIGWSSGQVDILFFVRGDPGLKRDYSDFTLSMG